MKIINFLLYGNVFIALCAYSQTVQTCRFLGDDNVSQSVLPIFVAAATFFLYNIHKPITFFLKKQLILLNCNYYWFRLIISTKAFEPSRNLRSCVCKLTS